MDDVVSEVTGTKESMLTSWQSVYSRSEFFVKSIPVILCSLTSSCMQDGERQRYDHGFIKTSPEYWCEFLIPAAGEMTSAHGAPGERGAVELNVSVFEREPLIYNTTAPQLWTHSDCWRNSDGDVLSLVNDTRYIYTCTISCHAWLLQIKNSLGVIHIYESQKKMNVYVY